MAPIATATAMPKVKQVLVAMAVRVCWVVTADLL
jgi:hypothetical protein